MKKLFIDTEFTDLHPEASLISIALVSEDGNYFYAELTDTYEKCECSDFVMNVVLPRLRGKECEMTENECALKIASWIEDQECEFMLACDNISWDFPHLRRLLNKTNVWPKNLSKTQFYKFTLNNEIGNKIVLENNYSPHNALDDAFIMLSAYRIGETREYR